MGVSADVADMAIASTVDHPADHILVGRCPKCDRAVDATCGICHSFLEAPGASVRGEIERMLGLMLVQRRVLQLIRSARNSKFMLECYFIAAGDSFADGISMKDLARNFSVRTATVSKQCHLICALFGIPPSRYMRDEKTCAKFRLSNRRPHKLHP